jgi:hypothetical protein
MTWLLRFFSPRAWQRHQFQQVQAQLNDLSMQIQGLQFEMTQSLQSISDETHMRLDKLQSTVEKMDSDVRKQG